MKGFLTTISALVCFTILTTSCGDTHKNDADDASDNTVTSTPQTSTTGTDITNETITTDDHGFMKAMNDMMDRMHKVEMTGNVDHDFAAMMIEHHQGSIDMSEIETRSGKDETMKALAKKIMEGQKEEQKMLRSHIDTHKDKSAKTKTESPMQQHMTKMMTGMESQTMTGDIDKDFATLMLKHHQDGMEMAKTEAEKGTEAKLKEMAKKMMNNQNKEIKELQNWLNKRKES